MKKVSFLRPLVEKMENHAMSRSGTIENREFVGLMLFVGIPLPGTGGWTGALIASIMHIKTRRALAAIFLGILLATVIMSIVSYGLLGLFIH